MKPGGIVPLAVALACVAASVFPCDAAAPTPHPTPAEMARTYEAVAADAGRLKLFCEMLAYAAASDDVDQGVMDGYLDRIGGDFRFAWDHDDTPDVEAGDSDRIDKAIARLYALCGS